MNRRNFLQASLAAPAFAANTDPSPVYRIVTPYTKSGSFGMPGVYPGQVVRVHKDTMRGMEAGPEGAEFVAIGAPGGPGDAVTVQDWWPRD